MRPQPPAQPPSPAPRRGGFTLLELLIAIAVIAVLISLLVPAVRQAFGSANNAAVSTEFSAMEAGLSQFHAEYGRMPPSLLNLSATDGGSGTFTFDDPKTMATLRNLFGVSINESQMIGSLIQTGIYNPSPTASPDLGAVKPVLRGAECLVFFLGGLPANSLSAGVPSPELAGFSTNPADPFNVSAPPGGPTDAGNFLLLDKQRRTGPFFAFEPSRLRAPDAVGEGFYFMYVDKFGSQETPILYTDSDMGRGYPTAADLFPARPDFGPHPDINYGVDHDAGTKIGGSVFADPNGTGAAAAALIAGPFVDAAGTPINPRGYQLISPGPDGVYGPGGTYVDGEYTPAQPGPSGDDNVANFSGGVMGG